MKLKVSEIGNGKIFRDKKMKNGVQELKSYPFRKVILIVYGIFGTLALLCLLLVPDSFMSGGLLRFIILFWMVGLLPLFLRYIYIFHHNVIYVSENGTVVETDRFYIADTRHNTYIVYFEDIIKMEQSTTWWKSAGGGFEEEYILLKTKTGRFHLKVTPTGLTIKELLKERNRFRYPTTPPAKEEVARHISFFFTVNGAYEKYKRTFDKI